MRQKRSFVLLALWVLAACGDDTSDGGLEDVRPADGGTSGDVDTDGGRDPDAAIDGGHDAGLDVPSGDAQFDTGRCTPPVTVELFSARAVGNRIEATVTLSNNAPCALQYRRLGSATWVTRMPTEDSSLYGVQPHVQQTEPLAPGTYEVRAEDHLRGCYTTNSLMVEIAAPPSCVDDIAMFTLPPPGTYSDWTSAHWDGLFPQLRRIYASGEVRSVVIDGVAAQEHRLVPTSGSQRNGSSRASGGWHLPPQQSYRLSQRIRLPENFAAGVDAQSGKLGFGLAGGSAPSGGNGRNDGFTARVIFDGDRTQPDTHAVVEPRLYIYAADQVGTYGDRVALGTQMRRGVWYTIDIEVVVNSSTQRSDGVLRAWIDGIQVFEATNRRWFAEGTPQVDRLTLATFHGGSTPRWAPSQVNEVAFAEVCIRR